jgi:hypothetical protein
MPDETKAVETDNSVRDSDGPQEIDGVPVSQDPTAVYGEEATCDEG